MKIVILGLSLSSSWGNGHATTYRALLGVLGGQHDVLFLERDQTWYAENRDMPEPPFCRLELYRDRSELVRFRREIETADAVIIGSYVPEGAAVARQIAAWVSGPFCFYDIDTPVTLAKLRASGTDYISTDTIPLFDLYLSFTGGPMLERLKTEFGAQRTAPLYCSVDETRYRPMVVSRRWDLGYLGTYSPDRQPALERLLLEPARRLPHLRFVVAGPMYPSAIVWPANVERIEHLPPEAHPEFYNSQRWTLNITRADMVVAGFSPSVRLFEASACGTPIISDSWSGLSTIFRPGQEIVLADGSDAVVAALSMAEDERARLGEAGRERCLAAHTARHRAAELEAVIRSLRMPDPSATAARNEGVLA
ncbi:MAG: glycosyltransferase [Proteobacteria bacterium]|nr:glycosyltransferase [Pseudomonadota bacterium]